MHLQIQYFVVKVSVRLCLAKSDNQEVTKTMKRHISLLLAVVLTSAVLGMSGCTDSETGGTSSKAGTSSSAGTASSGTSSSVNISSEEEESIYHAYSEVDSIDEFKTTYVNLMEDYFDSMNEQTISGSYDWTDTSEEDKIGLGAEGAQNMFDMDTETKWCSPCVDVEGCSAIIWSMTQAVTVEGYSLTTANDNEMFTDRNPVTWRLYGATELPEAITKAQIADGTVPDGWTLIDAVEGANLPDTNFTEVAMMAELPGTYTYFMFIIDKTENVGSSLQLSEFHLYGEVQE